METLNNLNISLIDVGISPVKFRRVTTMKVHSYAKETISQVQELITEKIASTGELDYDDLVQLITN